MFPFSSNHDKLWFKLLRWGSAARPASRAAAGRHANCAISIQEAALPHLIAPVAPLLPLSLLASG